MLSSGDDDEGPAVAHRRYRRPDETGLLAQRLVRQALQACEAAGPDGPLDPIVDALVTTAGQDDAALHHARFLVAHLARSVPDNLEVRAAQAALRRAESHAAWSVEVVGA